MSEDKNPPRPIRLVGFQDAWPVILAFAVDIVLQNLTHPSEHAVLISRTLLVLLSVVHGFLFYRKRSTRVFSDITVVAILAIYLFGQT